MITGINNIHAYRLKSIRKYINFNHDLRKPLSKYAKRRIKLYFDGILQLTSRPYHPYKSKNLDRLKKAKIYARHPHYLSLLNTAFIPVPSINYRITFDKNNNVHVKTQYIETHFLEFDKVKLVLDAEKHVEETISKNKNANAFTIACGMFEMSESFDRELIKSQIGFLTEKYDNSESNNYFGNWLHGLNAHKFSEQSSIEDYLKEKEKAKVENKKLKSKLISNNKEIKKYKKDKKKYIKLKKELKIGKKIIKGAYEKKNIRGRL